MSNHCRESQLQAAKNQETVTPMRCPEIAALLWPLGCSEPKTCFPLVKPGCQVLGEFSIHPGTERDFVLDLREAGALRA